MGDRYIYDAQGRLIGVSSDRPPDYKGAWLGCLGLLLVAAIGSILVPHPFEATPEQKAKQAQETQSQWDQQRHEALTQGRFLTADDLPALAGTHVPPHTFLVGTFTSDGGQSGGQPSVTAPVSIDPHIVHMWILFKGGIDVTKIRRGQTWTWAKEAPLRVKNVNRQRDGRIDVQTSEYLLYDP